MFIRIIIALLLILTPTQGWCVTQWAKGKPASVDNLTSYPTDAQANNSILDSLISNYRRGYNLTYSSSSTVVAAPGEITVSNAGGTVRLFLVNSVSSNVTFANLDTGAEASSTTYYIYCGTSTATDASCTFYISASSSAPTGVTYYARLGSFINDGSSNVSANSITNDNFNLSYVYSDWTAKSANTVYQAATDGIVVAWLKSSNNNTFFTGYSDGSNPPTTVRAYSSDATGANSTAGTTLTFPVRKNDYYKITYNTADSCTIYFMPIGS